MKGISATGNVRQMGFLEAAALLERYDIKAAEFRIAKNEHDVINLSRMIGYPQAMKIVSDDIIHKSDAGCVITDINNEKHALDAFAKIIKNASEYKPNAVIDGVMIQAMSRGIEVIIGMKRDTQFGPVMIFGLGGIFVEAIKDVSMRIAPVIKNDALIMIDDIKGRQLLEGARGTMPADKGRIADIICRMSDLAMKEEHVMEADLNPVMVDGDKISIVDVRILINDKQ